MDDMETIHTTVCRVCMGESICDPLDVEMEKTGHDEGYSITVGNIVIKYESSAPTTICRNCEILLQQCDRFKLRCKYNERILKKILKTLQLGREH